MSGHTPGPWSADKWAPKWTVSAPEAHYSVCHLEDCNNAEANARLIAAAPELYELAKSARSELAYVIAQTGVGDTILEQQLGEIIAKAEGR